MEKVPLKTVAVHGTKPHLRVRVMFYRQIVGKWVPHPLNPKTPVFVKLQGKPKVKLLEVGNVYVQKEEEAHAWARELIKINVRGIWQSPLAHDYFYAVKKEGYDNVKVREKMDGSDGETGAARKRGELPLPGTMQ